MKRIKRDIVIVGSGAGGATVAKELAGKGKKVIVLEKGSFTNKIGNLGYALLYYDKLALSKSIEGYIIYRNITSGGTTLCSCGNGVRALENKLKSMGIDLEKEFEETEKELNIVPLSDNLMGGATKRIMESACELGYEMRPMPKFIDEKCISCGNCIYGCLQDAKWSSRKYLKEAEEKGVEVLYGVDVRKVLVSGKEAVGVKGVSRGRHIVVDANIVVVAAGGIGTPVLLQNSGINSGNRLFVDFFNVTYGVHKDLSLVRDVTMGTLIDRFKGEGFILSPFIDNFLSLSTAMYFKDYPKVARIYNLLGIMCKIHDDFEGEVLKNGRVRKAPTESDRKKLDKGSDISRKILIKVGVDPATTFVTKPRGAHPGGTAAIGEVVDTNQETDVKALYVSDASVLPDTPGAPPIVTIVALSKRLAKHIIGKME